MSEGFVPLGVESERQLSFRTLETNFPPTYNWYISKVKTFTPFNLNGKVKIMLKLKKVSRVGPFNYTINIQIWVSYFRKIDGILILMI